MLPHEIRAAIAGNPQLESGYQTMLNWVAAGAQHPSWTQTAEQAATAAGISRYQPWYTSGAYQERQTPWGEGILVDASGNQLGSAYNPAWMSFVQGYRPPEAQAPAATTAPQVDAAASTRSAIVNGMGAAPYPTPTPSATAPVTENLQLGNELNQRLKTWSGA